MRIISVRWEPVARIFAIMYAIFGLGNFLTFTFTDAQSLTLPLGLIAPLFHLTLNLNLSPSNSLLYCLFSCFASILAYAITGWISGAAIAVCFNVVAKRIGGIDARYVSVIPEDDLVKFED